MRRFLLILSLLALAGMLSACGPIYETQYSYVPPTSKMGKMCSAQCYQGRNACERICELKNAKCFSRAHEAAQSKYAAYKNDQRDKGLPLTKKLKDFDESAICKKACNCTVSFNTCYSACGGQVAEKKVCVAFCGK